MERRGGSEWRIGDHVWLRAGGEVARKGKPPRGGGMRKPHTGGLEALRRCSVNGSRKRERCIEEGGGNVEADFEARSIEKGCGRAENAGDDVP